MALSLSPLAVLYKQKHILRRIKGKFTSCKEAKNFYVNFLRNQSAIENMYIKLDGKNIFLIVKSLIYC